MLGGWGGEKIGFGILKPGRWGGVEIGAGFSGVVVAFVWGEPV